MGASNANGVWKKAIFDQYLSNSEMMQDTIIVCPSFRMVPFLMTLSDLKWLIEIFNDTKHRAVSLRQLSFLLIWDPDLTISCNVLSWRFYCTLVSRRTSSILSPLMLRCVERWWIFAGQVRWHGWWLEQLLIVVMIRLQVIALDDSIVLLSRLKLVGDLSMNACCMHPTWPASRVYVAAGVWQRLQPSLSL